MSAHVLDWTPLFTAFHDAFAWMLDLGCDIARDYPDEVAAIERFRAFIDARVAGEDVALREEDMLMTIGLLVAAIERELGPMAIRAAACSRGTPRPR